MFPIAFGSARSRAVLQCSLHAKANTVLDMKTATIVLAVALVAPAAAADFTVTFSVTREVRGAVYPIDSTNSQCSSNDGCTCYGGAARRRTKLGSRTVGDDVIVLDTGSYFTGSGTFFYAFEGDASAEFFADSGYDAYGLTYRDLGAGSNITSLVKFLTKVSADDTDLPPATITNMNATAVTALGSLGSLVQTYTLVDISVGKVGVLSLTDPTHLDFPEYNDDLLQDYRRSLLIAVATLRDLPTSSRPLVIVCMISGMPVSHEEAHAAGSHTAAATAKLHTLVDEVIGVDLYILGDFLVTSSAPYTRTNWAGKSVGIITTRDQRYGKTIDDITATFTDLSVAEE